MIGAISSRTGSGSDYSVDFTRVRSSIRIPDGSGYIPFIASLRPRFAIVFRDITLGYEALLTTALLLSLSDGLGWLQGIAALVGAVLIGFWIAYLQLFMHEAAHFNLTRNRKWNDLIANIFVCAIGGQEITRYRRIHFQHHRALGRTDDTERTYANVLSAGFLLRTLLGLQSLQVIGSRGNHLSAEGASRGFLSGWIALTLLMHGSVIGAALWFRAYTLAIAWAAGAAIFFPFFGALRNLLEHRPERKTDDGEHAVTRIFGNDVFSRLYGAAGFNRHLLHHWEPQVSYTNLPDLEKYLASTPIKPIMDARRTTYWRTFKDLFEWKEG
jgi:fatty acid desaturase